MTHSWHLTLALGTTPLPQEKNALNKNNYEKNDIDFDGAYLGPALLLQ